MPVRRAQLFSLESEGLLLAAVAAGELLKSLPKVAAEMARQVLAYNLAQVMNIIGITPLNRRHQGMSSPETRIDSSTIEHPPSRLYTTKTRTGISVCQHSSCPALERNC